MDDTLGKPRIGGLIVTYAAGAILCLSLYVLSCGPTSVLCRAGYMSRATWCQIYWPIRWPLKRIEPSPLIDVHEGYVRKWELWFGYD